MSATRSPQRDVLDELCDKPPPPFSRERYHRLLDEAMDATKPPDSFLGRFVDGVIAELRVLKARG